MHPVLTGLRRGFIHNGGRIAFGPDAKLYAGVGETGETELAQDLLSMNGKILRLNPDGSVPADNPFPGSLVWSLGHRNVQGLAWDSSGRLWATEFGQDTFGEVNVIRRGHNYGWPEVEGRGPTEGGRFTNPVATWRTSDAFAERRGDPPRHPLPRRPAGRGPAAAPARRRARAQAAPPLLQDAFGRIRTVARAPDGSLWVATSNRDGRGSPERGDDRILRLP